MMSIQDFLFLSLAFGFIVLVVFISFATYRLAQTLESLKLLIDNVDDTAKDINIIKNKIKLGALTTAGALLGAFLKRRR